MLARQVLSHLPSAGVDRATEHQAVGPAEINVLEHAVGRFFLGQRHLGFKAVSFDPDNLSRLNIPYIFGIDQIQGAGLRGDDIGPIDPSEA